MKYVISVKDRRYLKDGLLGGEIHWCPDPNQARKFSSRETALWFAAWTFARVPPTLLVERLPKRDRMLNGISDEDYDSTFGVLIAPRTDSQHPNGF